MARHSLDQTSWLELVRYLEPARVRMVIVAVAGVAITYGINMGPWGDLIASGWELVFPVILAVAQGEWTRTVVSPSAVNGIE